MADSPALLCRVERACEMLACSRRRLYRLMDAGEIRSFRDGGYRKVVIASIHDYIRRKIGDDLVGGQMGGREKSEKNIEA